MPKGMTLTPATLPGLSSRGGRSGSYYVCDFKLNLQVPALKPSASSFKLTALKELGSANQITRRLSKEPIRAQLRLGCTSWEARARKKEETAAGKKKEGGRQLNLLFR